jgi:hypothetical protein
MGEIYCKNGILHTVAEREKKREKRKKNRLDRGNLLNNTGNLDL